MSRTRKVLISNAVAFVAMLAAIVHVGLSTMHVTMQLPGAAKLSFERVTASDEVRLALTAGNGQTVAMVVCRTQTGKPDRDRPQPQPQNADCPVCGAALAAIGVLGPDGVELIGRMNGAIRQPFVAQSAVHASVALANVRPRGPPVRVHAA